MLFATIIIFRGAVSVSLRLWNTVAFLTIHKIIFSKISWIFLNIKKEVFMYTFEKFMDVIFFVEKIADKTDSYVLTTILGVPEVVIKEADVCAYVNEHRVSGNTFEGSYYEVEKKISCSKLELAFQLGIGDTVFYQPIDYSKSTRNTSHIYYGKLATIIAVDGERYVVAFEDFPNCSNREKRNRFYANKEELLSVKCLAYACTFMDWYLLDLEDSYADMVDALCYSAGIDVDVYDDELSLENASLEAYRTLLLENSDYLNSYAECLYDFRDYIISKLVLWGDDVSNIEEHSVYKMLEVLYQYYQMKEVETSVSYISAVFTLVGSIDMEACAFAFKIGHTWFHNFNSEYFRLTNDVWTVGSITTEDDYCADLKCIYSCHADLCGASSGYTCAFYRTDNGKLIVRLYEHTKSHDPFQIRFSRLDIADIEMELSCIDDMAKLLADRVNTLAANSRAGSVTNEVYDICYDYCSLDGHEQRNLHERFTGSYLDLQDYLKNMREDDCCYNITATRIVED